MNIIEKFLFRDQKKASKRAVQLVNELGDLGTVKLRHYAYFCTAKDQNSFVESVRATGYVIETVHDEAPGDRPYSVCFSCLVNPAKESPEAARQELTALSARFDGEYDGWEIEVPHGSAVTS